MLSNNHSLTTIIVIRLQIMREVVKSYNLLYTGNIGYTRHRTKTIQRNWQHWVHKTQDKDNLETLATLGTQDEDNPETLATLGTQDTGRRQNKQKNHTTMRGQTQIT